jgi:hypothetical protein
MGSRAAHADIYCFVDIAGPKFNFFVEGCSARRIDPILTTKQALITAKN